MPEDERSVYDTIVENADVRLGEITDSVFQGLITGWNKVFVGEIVDERDGTAQFVSEGSDEPEPIEKGLLQRLLKGREIDHWDVDWKGTWLLFPYEIQSGGVELLTEEKLRAEYPLAWQFFQSHEEELKDREGGKWRDKEQWWAFSRRQNLKRMEPNKIMTNILSSYNRFTADIKDEYYFTGGYGIDLTEQYAPTSEDYLYYVALLNSRALEFYHKHIAPIFGGKYYSYNKRYLEPYPIVLPENAPEDTICSIAEDIQDNRKQGTGLDLKTSDIGNYLDNYERPSTLLDLADSIDLSGDSYRQNPIRTDETVGVETSEAVYRVVMKRSHTIGFDSEAVRDFAFELLTARDRRLSRSEVLNMAVPSAEDVLALMDEYESDEARIAELEAESDRLQAELNDVILRDIYNLSDEDVAVVEEFLDVW
jgi:hypothetical protein